jgi:hypothetical protein
MKLAESGPEKILGMRWIPKSDMFEFQVKINFSPKHRNIRTGKNNFILVFTIPLYPVSVPEIIQCLIENLPNASIVSVS